MSERKKKRQRKKGCVGVFVPVLSGCVCVCVCVYRDYLGIPDIPNPGAQAGCAVLSLTYKTHIIKAKVT